MYPAVNFKFLTEDAKYKAKHSNGTSHITVTYTMHHLQTSIIFLLVYGFQSIYN